MKRFFRKLGSWLWPWGFLKVALWTITLIVLFYAEEDWRGARAWAATKAKWEARGETFDYAKLVSPAVPADQNLAALPLFRLEPDPDGHPRGELTPVALHRALRSNELDLSGYVLPDIRTVMGGWQQRKLPDFPALRAGVAAAYAADFHRPAVGLAALDEYEALYPVVGELQAASAMRPYCRFEQGDWSQPPFNFRLITDQIALARALEYHGVLAFDAHRPDLTLQDIEIDLKLVKGFQAEPTLIAGLCTIGVHATSLVLIYDGLNLHVWNDIQLAGIENELASIDFLAAYQADLRGEACFSMTAFDRLKARRPGYGSELNARNGSDPSRLKTSDMFRNGWADGWIDLRKVQAADFDLNAVRFVDPKARLVFPVRADGFATEIARRQHGWSNDLWHILTDEAGGPIVEAVRHFAQAQALVDEARIACALERYRLAHGVYPDSLAELVPAHLPALPHDIMNGRPYRYLLQPNGSRLIYSVGWNLQDDGGTTAYRKDEPRAIDETKGDWVWCMPK